MKTKKEVKRQWKIKITRRSIRNTEPSVCEFICTLVKNDFSEQALLDVMYGLELGGNIQKDVLMRVKITPPLE